MSYFSFQEDISDMHDKFGVTKWIAEKVKEEDWVTLHEFSKFRLSCINEELNETKTALHLNNPEEVVDGLIDILVFTLGTLDAFQVDSTRAWKEVLRANISKKVGIKETRPNPFGLPDLVKPEGWEPPSHKTNHGILDEILRKDNNEN